VEVELDRDPPPDEVRALFRKYAGGLAFPLDFQNFDPSWPSSPAITRRGAGTPFLELELG
jgi:hypothetical protein